LAALEKQNNATSAVTVEGEAGGPDDMKSALKPPSIPTLTVSSKASSAANNVDMEPAPKTKEKSITPADPMAKLHHKKALLLRTVLLISFGVATLDRTTAFIHLALDV